MKSVMKRIAVVVLLAIAGFYGAWPAWSGYRIKTAIETGNEAVLEAKIEFPAVRTALKPIITAELERTVAVALKDAGPLGGLISGQLKGERVGRLVDSAMNSLITPANVVKIAHDSKTLRESVERVVKEQLGGLGGLGGILGGSRSGGSGPGPTPNDASKDAGSKPAPTGGQASGQLPGQPSGQTSGQPGAEPGRRHFGLSNLKRISINGPLSFSVGIARKPEATEPDVTAEMRFTGYDWKVVSLTPRLDAATQ